MTTIEDDQTSLNKREDNDDDFGGGQLSETEFIGIVNQDES